MPFKMLRSSRKGLAAALAVAGIASMSLASAAKLDLTGAGTLQAGSLAPITVDCQAAPILVRFGVPTLVGGEYRSTRIDLTGIEPACVGKRYKLAVVNAAGARVAGVPQKTGITSPTLFVTLRATLPRARYDSITRVSLTIYS